MDDLNILHVLGQAVEDIGHGVTLLSPQNEIPSKTMVCYLDGKQSFHYGFCYKNGSNLRVVTWENDEKKLKTVPKGSSVIAFHGKTSQKTIRANFTANDFHLDWFGEEAKDNVKKELKSLIEKSNQLEDIVQGLCGLTIQELGKVKEKIEELKNE